MTIRKRSIGAALAMLLGIVGALAVVAPASAASYAYVGVDGNEARCHNLIRSCLYYST